MAKIYQRLLSTNILREKRLDLFDPQRENLLGEDSICIVNLLEMPQVIPYSYLNSRVFNFAFFAILKKLRN